MEWYNFLDLRFYCRLWNYSGYISKPAKVALFPLLVLLCVVLLLPTAVVATYQGISKFVAKRRARKNYGDPEESERKEKARKLKEEETKCKLELKKLNKKLFLLCKVCSGSEKSETSPVKQSDGKDDTIEDIKKQIEDAKAAINRFPPDIVDNFDELLQLQSCRELLANAHPEISVPAKLLETLRSCNLLESLESYNLHQGEKESQPLIRLQPDDVKRGLEALRAIVNVYDQHDHEEVETAKEVDRLRRKFELLRDDYPPYGGFNYQKLKIIKTSKELFPLYVAYESLVDTCYEGKGALEDDTDELRKDIGKKISEIKRLQEKNPQVIVSPDLMERHINPNEELERIDKVFDIFRQAGVKVDPEAENIDSLKKKQVRLGNGADICYINAMLQFLFRYKPLTRALKAGEFGDSHKPLCYNLKKLYDIYAGEKSPSTEDVNDIRDNIILALGIPEDRMGWGDPFTFMNEAIKRFNKEAHLHLPDVIYLPPATDASKSPFDQPHKAARGLLAGFLCHCGRNEESLVKGRQVDDDVIFGQISYPALGDHDIKIAETKNCGTNIAFAEKQVPTRINMRNFGGKDEERELKSVVLAFCGGVRGGWTSLKNVRGKLMVCDKHGVTAEECTAGLKECLSKYHIVTMAKDKDGWKLYNDSEVSQLTDEEAMEAANLFGIAYKYRRVKAPQMSQGSDRSKDESVTHKSMTHDMDRKFGPQAPKAELGRVHASEF